jgi:hypothetical protein
MRSICFQFFYSRLFFFFILFFFSESALTGKIDKEKQKRDFDIIKAARDNSFSSSIPPPSPPRVISRVETANRINDAPPVRTRCVVYTALFVLNFFCRFDELKACDIFSFLSTPLLFLLSPHYSNSYLFFFHFLLSVPLSHSSLLVSALPAQMKNTVSPSMLTCIILDMIGPLSG